MDAVKILGGLLGGGGMTSRQGNDMLGNMLGSALGGQSSGGSGGLEDLLGGVAAHLGGGGAGGSARSGGAGGSLGDLLGGALAGGSGRGAPAGGGLGDLLGAALGGGRGGGGIGDLLGAALGGGGGSRGGGMGGMLGKMAMAALVKYAAGKMSGAGGRADVAGLLGNPGAAEAMAQFDSPEINAQAEVLVEAMINAAKSDGRIDAREERAILGQLGELDAEEAAFVRAKLEGPADARAVAAKVPAGMGQEVYAASLLAVELDERSEAVYLRDLAQALGLDAATCNGIHAELGAPQIFR